MKHLKKILIMVLALAICVTPVDIYAAGKNVTSSMKQDKNLRKISRDIALYTSAELCNARSKRIITERLNGYNALSIAGYLGVQSYPYRSASYSQKHINGYTKKDIQKITYDLFGNKPKTNTIPLMTSSKKKWIAKSTYPSSKPYQYSGGSWGNYVPSYSIKRIVRIKKNVYDITITNGLGLYMSKTKRTVGTTYIRIKKNPRSIYGYNITRLRYKGNGQGF